MFSLSLWESMYGEILMIESEELEYRRDCLEKRRNYFLESIAAAADEIKRIDEPPYWLLQTRMNNS